MTSANVSPNELVTVAVRFAGICGSDLQKFETPGIDFASLGHELVGQLDGETVVVSPLWGCGTCAYCTTDMTMLCPKLRALGRTEPGGFSGSVSVPRANIFPFPASQPALGVLVDPYAVVRHGLATRLQAQHVAIIGDGIISQLCALYLSQRAGHMTSCVLITKSEERQPAATRFMRQLSSENARLTSASAKEAEAMTSQFDMVIEAVGRNQSATIQRAITLVRPGGTVLSFGVFPVGYQAAVPLRELLYKEAALVGSNSFNPPDFSAAADELLTRPDIFLPLLGEGFAAGDHKQAIRAATDKGAGLPKKIFLEF